MKDRQSIDCRTESRAYTFRAITCCLCLIVQTLSSYVATVEQGLDEQRSNHAKMVHPILQCYSGLMLSIRVFKVGNMAA